ATPELTLERMGIRLDCPRAVAQRLIAPEPVENDSQVPVAHPVTQEEEVTPAQLRRQRHRHGPRHVASREVVDVVVLGDDEALPLSLRAAINLTVQLEDYGPLLERQLRCVRVRQIDQ